MTHTLKKTSALAIVPLILGLAATPGILSAQAGTLPASSFPMDNVRFLSQNGQNTATVTVLGPQRKIDNTARLRRAANQWCGGRSSVNLLSGTERGNDSQLIYLIKCL